MINISEISKEIDKHTNSKVEKFIEKLSPAMAERRLEAKINKLMMPVSWKAASKMSSSLEQFSAGITDADSSMDWGQRETIVARSRDNIRNVPIASGIINRIVDHAIGPAGLTFHPQIDAETLGMGQEEKLKWEKQALEYFKMWAESPECDFSRTLNFYEQNSQALRSQLEGGDCFDIMTDLSRPGSPFKLKLQTVEGEMASNPNRTPNSTKMVEGIEKDDNGVPIRIHFSKYHPGNIKAYGATQNWVPREIFGKETGRRNILHHYVQLRPGQTRGIPLLGPVTEKLLNLNRYSRAELLAAVLNSYYTLVIKGDKGSTAIKKKSPGSTGTRSKNDKIQMGSGSIFRVGANEDVKAFDPSRPNHQYMPFWQAMVLEVGAHCGVPKSIILMMFDKSYSASRGEVILFWVTVLAHRVRTAVGRCQPAWEALLDELVVSGKMQAPGYFRDPRIRRAFRGSAYSQWTGPVREAIDELKEAKAAEAKIAAGIKSRKMISAETDGVDWESEVMAQLKHEHELLVAAGMEEPGTFDLTITEEAA